MHRAGKLVGLAGERVALLVVGGLIVAAFVALAVWFVQERRQILRDQGYRAGESLAHVLQAQVAGSVRAIDLTLQHVSDTLGLLPGLPADDPSFRESLRRNLPRLPLIRAMFVVAPDGFIVHDTDYPLTPRRNLADRDYFVVHAGDESHGLYIGPPLQSRSTGTWFISLSRRVSRPDGSFGGVVAAALEVDRFTAFYRRVQMRSQDAIALFLQDGTLLLRVPETGMKIGQPMRDIRPFREPVPTGAQGSFRTESGFDKIARLVSYRALNDYPIVVSVALSEQALLVPWRRNVVLATSIALATAVGLVALTVLLIRQRRRIERVRERHLQAQRFETLGRMTGGIAHDVNNILAVIASGTRSLGRSEIVNKELLSRITESVDQGHALMMQLLSFAKSQKLKVVTISIADRIERLQPLMRQAAGFAIDISIRIPADIKPCRADPTQFDAAILNLVVNARDAMLYGGQIAITAGNLSREDRLLKFSVPAGEYVELRIADTGEGMSPETERKAIEPFFSTKGEAGTGLGLSQVYGFMRQIGGDLRIESRLGKGTVVHLIFPRAAGSDAASDPARPHGSDKAAPPAPELRLALND